ncbi:iron permease [Bacillus cereus]|uniref:iron permease n=1 Tax=Bacillus cereus TaxID=1396 RepID=UPI0024059158|nr:iron permease [Bacillus cereus]MDF9599547.1 iron permease [Bacillus cereus]MDG1589166.1 iron permease [Bacillus cereus]
MTNIFSKIEERHVNNFILLSSYYLLMTIAFWLLFIPFESHRMVSIICIAIEVGCLYFFVKKLKIQSQKELNGYIIGLIILALGNIYIGGGGVFFVGIPLYINSSLFVHYYYLLGWGRIFVELLLFTIPYIITFKLAFRNSQGD